MTKNNGLAVITGPSGVGKGTLVKKLLIDCQDIWLSISATTRPPREGEVDGKDYFFLETNEFQELIETGSFLEWAKFAGNFYGTPRHKVQEQLSIGKKVLLEIELDGARQVRKSFKDAFHIFIAPPSFQELEKRIRGRGTDKEESIKLRLDKAKDELNSQNEFDAVVINDDIDFALLEIKSLLKLSRN